MEKNEMVRITDNNTAYVSMTVTSRQEKAIFFNAIENPEAKISDFINSRMVFSHVSMQACEFEDEETGEIRKTVRTVFITPEGGGIISTSMGIARALYNLFDIFGTPDTWDCPMEVFVRQIETKKGRTFKLEVC